MSYYNQNQPPPPGYPQAGGYPKPEYPQPGYPQPGYPGPPPPQPQPQVFVTQAPPAAMQPESSINKGLLGVCIGALGCCCCMEMCC